MIRRSKFPVLIGSWLDADQVDRMLEAEGERIELLYAPELLPVPRYVADHHAAKRFTARN